MLGIMHDIFSAPDLSNRKQIQDIILEERNNLNASVIGSGHQMALLLSSAPICHSRRIEEVMGGISQLRFLDRLAGDDGADQHPATAALHARFKPLALLLVETDKALRVREPGVGDQAR